MASTKAVKVAGAAAQAKEPAPKLSETATKPSAAKSGVKKAEQKPREPKKKVITPQLCHNPWPPERSTRRREKEQGSGNGSQARTGGGHPVSGYFLAIDRLMVSLHKFRNIYSVALSSHCPMGHTCHTHIHNLMNT